MLFSINLCVLVAVRSRGASHVRNAALAERFFQKRLDAILPDDGRNVPIQRVFERDRGGVNGIDPGLTDHKTEALDVLFQLARHFDNAQIGKRTRLQTLAVDLRPGLQNQMFHSARQHPEHGRVGLSDVRFDVVDQFLKIRSVAELLPHFLQDVLNVFPRFLRRHARHKIQGKVSQRLREEPVAHVQRDLDFDRLSVLVKFGALGKGFGIDRGQVLRDADVMRGRELFDFPDRKLKRRQAQRARCFCVIILISDRFASAAAFSVVAEKHVKEAVPDLIDLKLRVGREDIVFGRDRFAFDAVVFRDNVFEDDRCAVTVRYRMEKLKSDAIVPIRDPNDRLRFVPHLKHFAQLIRLLDQDLRVFLERGQPVLQKAFGKRDEMIRKPFPHTVNGLQQRRVVDRLIQPRLHTEPLRPGFCCNVRIDDPAGIQRQRIKGFFQFHILRQKRRFTSRESFVARMPMQPNPDLYA